MSKWLMWDHYRHLHFNNFSMTWRTPQGEVFWPLQSNSEVLGDPEDSQVPIPGVWVSSSHSSKGGVVTIELLVKYNWFSCEKFVTWKLLPLTIVFGRFTCTLTTLLALLAPLPLYLDNLQPILSFDQFMFYLQDNKNNSQNACPICTQVPNTWNFYLTLHD